MKNDTPQPLHPFVALLAAAPSKALLEELLDLFFTLEEKHMLHQRLRIIEALQHGDLTQREIADTYQVSIAQITRGSNALKVISPALSCFLKKHLKWA